VPTVAGVGAGRDVLLLLLTAKGNPVCAGGGIDGPPGGAAGPPNTDGNPPPNDGVVKSGLAVGLKAGTVVVVARDAVLVATAAVDGVGATKEIGAIPSEGLEAGAGNGAAVEREFVVVVVPTVAILFHGCTCV